MTLLVNGNIPKWGKKLILKLFRAGVCGHKKLIVESLIINLIKAVITSNFTINFLPLII